VVKARGINAFKAQLVEAGAELLGPTNPYEVLRFRSKLGVGVIYSGRRGETWNAEAIAAREHLASNKGSLAPVAVRGRRNDRATVSRLIERDGEECFFCGRDLGGDITIEHLVAIAHGGPNHISNLFLAHAACNQRAGHLSGPEKVAQAIEARRAATGNTDAVADESAVSSADAPETPSEGPQQ
jgi:5-methylcytosine-specific restriction endonuclease McrA